MFWKTEHPAVGLDLEDFVRETIVSVFQAVKDAGTEIANNPLRSGAVVPAWNGEHFEQEISFDIAVTIGMTREDGVKPKIKVLGLAELGGAMSNRAESSRVSRVSFSVPVALPATIVNNAGVRKRQP